jgi:hypothetical protein
VSCTSQDLARLSKANLFVGRGDENEAARGENDFPKFFAPVWGAGDELRILSSGTFLKSRLVQIVR